MNNPELWNAPCLFLAFEAGIIQRREKLRRRTSEVLSDQIELMNGILGSEPVAFDLPHETGRATDGKGDCPLGNALLQPLFAYTGDHIFVKLRFHTYYFLQKNRFCLILRSLLASNTK